MSAFAQDLVALLPRLRRFAQSLTGRADSADDLVQSACERALRSQDQWEPGTRLDAWMFRIIRNLWLDGLRRRKTEGVQEAMDDGFDVAGEDGRHTTEMRLTAQAVEGALDRLAPEARDVIRFVCIEDLSYRETAERLGIPIGTVMSRLSRARLALAREIGLDANERIGTNRGQGP
jgi:RNA polymerase sigma-70 factor (ECF subfamily)